ncbi:DNA repair protein RecN [Rhodoplanes sp. TEM]|uniref:DNA repair protein RecN n=1 Tax=Rhodoplanes tepidamans TaxID=200616 RepID=A0ABT5J6R1_RHOTP|nr:MULTISPECIES: DNA repair protein RecN [Rhodoplanes]MDC7785341.1 DNA repair protein RecN [Rhodoplanes tepidamans]MDC7986280.1 DNA repair protein RecN [Rhodoplanes sp. TEM]MDQ0353207.1 DNA repair protein RecN (Recombination protein N) [Rhodoplanes tepidamans]
MLARLSIRDIVLIDRLDLDFGPGLAVLTGETGAGKSILLDAFALALGARGDAALVRSGAEQGQITAVFEPDAAHPVNDLLRDNDIPVEDQLLLRRVQLADGRTRAFVNDQPVSVKVLESLGERLVEIHGQHDARALVDPASHRSLLDAYGGLERDAESVARLWAARRDAEQTLAAHRAEVERAQREADWLRHAVDELRTLAPEPGEETTLADRRSAMMQAEKAADDLRDALAVVSGPQSPGPALAAAVRRLERRGTAGGYVAPAVAAIDAALTALDEARGHLEAALAAGAFDPRTLERIEERLFALRAAGRKYDVAVDGLAALAERYASDLALIDAGAERLARLEREAAEAAGRFDAAAAALSSQRRRAAEALDKALAGELKPLKLERARFATAILSEPERPGPHGLDRVEFQVQTNPGTAPGPLMKIASGGELSRFLLALKVVIADRGSAPTLVFDEIDTAVGGAVADAIGVRLARLGGTVQVIAVTHAPQVAARADRHLLISKGALDRGKRVATRVAVLDDGTRREEIARMLSGAEITAEARAAADRLLKAAAG